MRFSSFQIASSIVLFIILIFIDYLYPLEGNFVTQHVRYLDQFVSTHPEVYMFVVIATDTSAVHNY